MTIRSVWFWFPFHMLQAYPMVRNLPLPDFMVPFAHLMWVIMYIAEHWTGLAGPVKAAFEVSSKVGIPFAGICLLSFFGSTFIISEKKVVVAIGFVLYIGFMMGAKQVGLIGSPKKTYDEQIEANVNPKWNDHHVILHVWYITILWVVALTVPYEDLEHQSLHPIVAIGIMVAAVVWIVGMLIASETVSTGKDSAELAAMQSELAAAKAATEKAETELANALARDPIADFERKIVPISVKNHYKPHTVEYSHYQSPSEFGTIEINPAGHQYEGIALRMPKDSRSKGGHLWVDMCMPINPVLGKKPSGIRFEFKMKELRANGMYCSFEMSRVGGAPELLEVKFDKNKFRMYGKCTPSDISSGPHSSIAAGVWVDFVMEFDWAKSKIHIPKFNTSVDMHSTGGVCNYEGIDNVILRGYKHSPSGEHMQAWRKIELLHDVLPDH
jgi:hypothetical protein